MCRIIGSGRAEKLLTETDLSVTEIAYATGFQAVPILEKYLKILLEKHQGIIEKEKIND